MGRQERGRHLQQPFSCALRPRSGPYSTLTSPRRFRVQSGPGSTARTTKRLQDGEGVDGQRGLPLAARLLVLPSARLLVVPRPSRECRTATAARADRRLGPGAVLVRDLPRFLESTAGSRRGRRAAAAAPPLGRLDAEPTAIVRAPHVERAFLGIYPSPPSRGMIGSATVRWKRRCRAREPGRADSVNPLKPGQGPAGCPAMPAAYLDAAEAIA